jgi:hypothetical protein
MIAEKLSFAHVVAERDGHRKPGIVSCTPERPSMSLCGNSEVGQSLP